MQPIDQAKPLVLTKDIILPQREEARKIAEERGMILPLDKSLGNSSFSLVAKCRKAFGMKKVGHAGTLDPLATGVVVIAIGRKATKHIDSIMDSDKTYRGSLVLGLISETDDAEGPINENEAELPDIGYLTERFTEMPAKYTGTVEQTIPKYSARRIKGKRMYKLARQGEDFDPPKTIVNISSAGFSPPKLIPVSDIADMTLPEYRGNLDKVSRTEYPLINFEIVCGKGTYIRSIVREIGEVLGTGAYMTSLRRTVNSGYDVDECWKDKDIDELIDNRKT
jgi:tRNA pseudouridine55 synthase